MLSTDMNFKKLYILDNISNKIVSVEIKLSKILYNILFSSGKVTMVSESWKPIGFTAHKFDIILIFIIQARTSGFHV
jgi:hypothetical protein